MPAPRWMTRNLPANVQIAITLSLVALFFGYSAAMVMTARHLGREFESYQTLLEYQLAKIDTRPVPDTVFIGDSSLGNAIDADAWSQMSGKSAANYALTAAFGLDGSYNVLRRILTTGRPRQVIFVHTARTFVSGTGIEELSSLPEPGFIAAARRFIDLSMTLKNVLAAHWWVWRSVSRRLTTGVWPPPEGHAVQNDYVRQGPKLPAYTESLHIAEITTSSGDALKRIADLCAEAGIQCRYVHGPLVETICHGAYAYFDAVNRHIKASGMALVSERPVCIPENETGDSADHVAPDMKALYTELYFKRIGH